MVQANEPKKNILIRLHVGLESFPLRYLISNKMFGLVLDWCTLSPNCQIEVYMV
jgi:hypothetical protein